MIPVQFEYATADSVQEAVEYLQAHPAARVLAGGTALLPALSRRRLTPLALLDLQHITELGTITRQPSGALRIGALAPLVVITEQPGIDTSYPALVEAINAIGDPQIRNRGTLGGNLALNNAPADAAAALLALGATVTIAGPESPRSGPIETLQLAPSDVITFIDLPEEAPGSAYEKFRNPASLYAICGVAALVRLAANGTVSQCRIAVTGATTGLTRLALLEEDLVGRPSASVAPGDEAFQAQLSQLTFTDDWVASAEYRAHLTQVLTIRSLQRAADRARRQSVS
jgi:carbon-monoxide dehydrogenase medium subunit